MREIKCACGQDVTTPFCPECGHRRDGPLTALYRHVAGVALTNAKRVRRLEKGRDELTDRLREGAEHGLTGARATAAKWRGWADALRDILDSQEPEDGQ